MSARHSDGRFCSNQGVQSLKITKDMAMQTTRQIALQMAWLFLVLGCASPTEELSPGTASDEPSAAKPEATPPTDLVPVAKAEAHEGALEIEVPCTLVGDQEAELMARIEGYVESINAFIGDELETGDVLATIAAPELVGERQLQERLVSKARAERNTREAEVAQAEARLEELGALRGMRESEVHLAKELVEGGAVKQEKLDQANFALQATLAEESSAVAKLQTTRARVEAAQVDVDVALAKLENAEVLAGFRQIRAPFAGTVTQRSVDQGDLVRPAMGMGGEPLFRLVRIDRLRAIAHIPLDRSGHVDDQDPVRIHSLMGRPGEAIHAHISRHTKAFEQQSRMMRIEVDLENSQQPDGRWRLLPGDYGKLIVTLEEKEPAVVVPASAVWQSEGSPRVVKVHASGACQALPVQVGQSDDPAETVVLAGLAPGDLVIARRPEAYSQVADLSPEVLIEQ